MGSILRGGNRSFELSRMGILGEDRDIGFVKGCEICSEEGCSSISERVGSFLGGCKGIRVGSGGVESGKVGFAAMDFGFRLWASFGWGVLFLWFWVS